MKICEMSSINRISLLSFTLFLLQVIQVTLGQIPQYVMFYPIDNCFGDEYEYSFDSIQNLTGNQATPVSLAGRGLWEVKEHDKGNSEDIQTRYLVGGDGSICHRNLTNKVLLSVTKLLNSDMDESAIVFYNDSTSATEVKDTQKSFETPLVVTTVAFTGIRNYTIFDTPNFTGTAICLGVSQYSVDLGLNLNYYSADSGIITNSTYWTVGSVRIGCNGQEKQIVHGG